MLDIDHQNGALREIDLKGATDVSALTGQTALAAKAVSKTLFLDIVTVLNVDHGIPVADIPAKLEGVTFGQDVLISSSSLRSMTSTCRTSYRSTSGPVTTTRTTITSSTPLTRKAGPPARLFLESVTDFLVDNRST